MTATINTATLVKALDGFRGDARLYRVDPPMRYLDYIGDGEYANLPAEYVIVSALEYAFDTGEPETFIFPATEHGEVEDWGELHGSLRGVSNHEAALFAAGYALA